MNLPLRHELHALAEAAGLYSAPAPNDPRTCVHAWGFWLNPQVVPAWLIDATSGKVSPPEVPGEPQVFRADAYIDWLALLDAHSDELEVVHEWTPTARSLAIVEELRGRGYDASITAQVYLLRKEEERLVFGVEASAIGIDGTHADTLLQEYERDLDDAMNVVPKEQRAVLVLYPGERYSSWQYC